MDNHKESTKKSPRINTLIKMDGRIQGQLTKVTDILMYKMYMGRLRNQRVNILNKNIGERFKLPNFKAYYTATIILFIWILKFCFGDNPIHTLHWYGSGWLTSLLPQLKALPLCIHPHTLCLVWFPRSQPQVKDL